jgi:hypothetical protein
MLMLVDKNIIFRNDDGSIEATAIYGLGEIECQKDTAELLALAFTPKLNAALKRIVHYKRNENGQLISDGSLAVYKKNSPQAGAERKTAEAGERSPQVGAEREALSIRNLNQGAEGKAETDITGQTSMFYTILDRTHRLGDEDILVLNVPISVYILVLNVLIRDFITGDQAFYATVVGKEGRGPVLGGPLVYVAGTFSKLTSLTQTFLLLRGRSPHFFSSNSFQKSGCLGTSF